MDAVRIYPLSCDLWVSLHWDFDFKVPTVMSFSFETHCSIVINSFWKSDLLTCGFSLDSCCLAGWTRMSDLFSFTSTWVARSSQDHHALSEVHVSSTLARSTFLWLSTRFWLFTLAGGANSFFIILEGLRLKEIIPSSFHSLLRETRGLFW